MSGLILQFCSASTPMILLHQPQQFSPSTELIPSPSASCQPSNADTPELPSRQVLGLIGDNVAGHIAGFIGAKIAARVKCDSCHHSLINSEHLVTLTSLKDRGGLFRPSAGLCRLARICERQFRAAQFRLPTSQQVDRLLTCTVAEASAAELFSDLQCYQAADESHRYFIIRESREKYLIVV